MSDMNCPYCGVDCEVCHDDGFGYSEDELHEHECHECEKIFVFQTCIHFVYTPKKADCLNGFDHHWTPTFVYPIEYTKGRCDHCGLERKATPEDMVAALVERENLAKNRIAAGDE